MKCRKKEQKEKQFKNIKYKFKFQPIANLVSCNPLNLFSLFKPVKPIFFPEEHSKLSMITG